MQVTALAYTSNEAYLVSTGADHVILVWDLMVNKVRGGICNFFQVCF